MDIALGDADRPPARRRRGRARASDCCSRTTPAPCRMGAPAMIASARAGRGRGPRDLPTHYAVGPRPHARTTRAQRDRPRIRPGAPVQQARRRHDRPCGASPSRSSASSSPRSPRPDGDALVPLAAGPAPLPHDAAPARGGQARPRDDRDRLHGLPEAAGRAPTPSPPRSTAAIPDVSHHDRHGLRQADRLVHRRCSTRSWSASP